MQTQILKQTKTELTVTDYQYINKYRLALEQYYNWLVKFESNNVLCKIVDEINQVRKHLNMNKL